MTKGKCNCGKKATSEYLIVDKKENAAHSLKFCDKCKPKRDTGDVYRIDK